MYILYYVLRYGTYTLIKNLWLATARRRRCRGWLRITDLINLGRTFNFTKPVCPNAYISFAHVVIIIIPTRIITTRISTRFVFRDRDLRTVVLGSGMLTLILKSLTCLWD